MAAADASDFKLSDYEPKLNNWWVEATTETWKLGFK
jgi:hypothetical protein